MKYDLPILFIAFVCLIQCVSLDGQAIGCERHTPHLVQVDCTYGQYRLPGNFDVSQLDPHVEYSTITRAPSDTVNFNVVERDFSPLPYRAGLFAVSLHFFNMGPGHARFPLNGLFHENKAHIRQLSLTEVKLGDLTGTDFNGFNQLEHLYIGHCQVLSIDVNTFNGLGLLPSGLPIDSYRPTLLGIYLDQKTTVLRGLDWSFLAPVASSLEVLIVQLQPGKITRSWPFILERARHVQFNDNQLDRVPSEVYTTINSSLSLILAFAGQRYCRTSQERFCGCCEMKGFVDWLRETEQVSALTHPLQCGANPAWTVTAKEIFEKPDLHSHCAAPPQVTSKIAPTTARSTAGPQPTAHPTPAQPVDSICDNGFVVRCSKGVVSAPSTEIDDVDASCAQFIGDGGHRCRVVSFALHEWILEQTGAGRKSRSISGGVVASCSGRGVVQVNEHDPDTVVSTEVTVQTANTAKCRDFFYRFLEQLFELKN